MQQFKRLVIVAGEESGDLHAASFVRELKKEHASLHISGVGGQHMQDAGVELISDLARFGITGVMGILQHMRVIRRAALIIKEHLKKNPPDLLVLVDYPGFNLRLARWVKKNLNVRILYYISPQIWAWKAGRIHAIHAYIDHMAVILPFEKELYTKAQVPVSFVGHPLIETLEKAQKNLVTRAQLGLPEDSLLLALLPGSRIHEIKYHMPVLCQCINQLSQKLDKIHAVIPVSRSIDPELIRSYLKNTTCSYTLIDAQAVAVMQCSDAVIVASGTASLECALLQKPMCIIYKGGLLSYLIVSQVIRVKYFGLCNLLLNAMVVPELLQYDCTPDELTRTILSLLTQKNMIHRLTLKLQHLHHTLSAQQADSTISALIWQELQKITS